MSKVINCHYCNKYLGEIRDAKLHKYIVYLCGECQDKLDSLSWLMMDKMMNNDKLDEFDWMKNNDYKI